MRKPDYTQILKVLKKEVPDRPTLFEFFMNESIYDEMGGGIPLKGDKFDFNRKMVHGFKNCGYDYVTSHASSFGFPAGERERKSSYSINDGHVITCWDSYEKYKWQDPEDFGQEALDAIAPDLPEGMKIIAHGPGGVLENAIALAGYDNLCMMLYDEPGLARRIFDDIGSRLVRYYELAAAHEAVCAIISNDDWGFKTQTMLSTAHMREYVFPWHKKIVETGRKHGKPVLLHSCGFLEEVMEDIIEDMRYDGKHSFEDAIQPIEDAYEKYKGRIALLGGIDVHFVCTASPEEIAARSRAMLEIAAATGGYALGTGNSVPEYVPKENYYAMIDVVRNG